MTFWIGVFVGWTGGSVGMWVYFARAKLIRNREEWYRATRNE